MTESILLLAATLSFVACTGPHAVPAGPVTSPQPVPTSPGSMIAGTISVSVQGTDSSVRLRDYHGDVVRLVGTQLNALVRVNGGDVIAFGSWDANPDFVVTEFQVVGMHGRPALDGVLELSVEGYALRLSNGSLRSVPSLTGDCADYVGSRLWVVGWDEGSDVVFGRIA